MRSVKYTPFSDPPKRWMEKETILEKNTEIPFWRHYRTWIRHSYTESSGWEEGVKDKK
jgi:hypothetical protein